MTQTATAAGAAALPAWHIPIEQDYGTLCREDIQNFYKKHNPDKLSDVEKIIADAKKKGIASMTMFDMLYKRYNVTPFVNRDGILSKTQKLHPSLTLEEILHEMRKLELKGIELLGDGDDYFQALKRVENDKKEAARLAAMQPRRMRALTVAQSKAKVDEVMALEAAEWLISVLQDEATEALRNATGSDMVDTLRDGVLLQILIQKLQNPKIQREQIKRPKATGGFQARDNVSRFVQAVRGPPFNLRPEVLFTDVDLCDAKNDRQVVSCLLALAKIAYHQNLAPAPSIVKYDQEIEEQQKKLPSETELETIIAQDEDEELETDSARKSESLANLQEAEREQLEEGAEERLKAIAAEEERVRRLFLHVHSGIMKELQEELLERTRKEFNVPAPTPQPIAPTPTPQPTGAQRLPETNVTHMSSVTRRLQLPAPSAPMLVLVQSQSPPRDTLPRSEPLNVTSSPPGSPSSFYQARRGDEVDKHVGKAVNNIMKKFEAPKTKIKRLRQQGQYVIYHKITHKRTVVFVRVVQKQLMIRVGGGWEDFEEYLQRRMVEWETVPRNRLNHPEALPTHRRRDNTV